MVNFCTMTTSSPNIDISISENVKFVVLLLALLAMTIPFIVKFYAYF